MAKPTSSQRVARLIALIGQLTPDTRIPLARLAEEVGASVPELASDLESLSMCGVTPYDPGCLMPIFVEDEHLEVFGELPAIRGPVRLSSVEARALVAALQAAGFTANDDLPARLLATSAAVGFSAQDVEHTIRTATATHENGVYQALARAVEERGVVRIEYVTAGTATPTSRDIEPVSLFAERGAWYVTSWCRRAHEWRTFRVDRIRTADLTGETCPERSGRTGLTGMSFDPEGLPVARLRFAADEDFMERDWPNGAVGSTDEDGRTIAEVPYAGTSWISRRVVARMGAVEVLAPAEVRDAVAALATGLLESETV